MGTQINLPKEPHEPQERAKLRVYLGAAPGVGKTYRMLEHAHMLRQQGVDVVVGLVETHGRAETAALIRDLEIIPQKEIVYRSVTLPEMDIDAILVRRPDTCVVDELAHSNAPGAKNEKRYQDALELLDQEISVISTLAPAPNKRLYCPHFREERNASCCSGVMLSNDIGATLNDDVRRLF